MSLFRKRWVWIYIITILLVTFVTIINIFIYNNMTNCLKAHSVVHYQPYNLDEVQCYRARVDFEKWDTDWQKQASDKTIYFLDTSCKGGLDSRQACVVESAARAHPYWDIVVYFLGPLHELFLKSSSLKSLKSLDNVNFSRLDLTIFLENKAVSPIFNKTFPNITEGLWKNRPLLLSDLLRFFILRKYGGIYLDLDIIVTRSFKKLPKNWIARQSANKLGAGAVSLSNDHLGRDVAWAALQSISELQSSSQYINKEKVLTRALQKICYSKNIMEMKADTCRGLEILDYYNFYLMNSTNWQYYLRPGTHLSILDTYFAYGHKTWSSVSSGMLFAPYTKLALIAKQFCPNIYQVFGKDFGS